MSFLEQRSLPYIVVTRMTQWVKREAQRIQKWMELDANYAVGQSWLKLHGWTTERRFVVIRERVRESRASVGRKLIDVPGYTFRIFVTNRNDAPEEIWQDYNRRADMENRIAELRHDLGANHFCLKQFHATAAAFRAVLFLFNLLSEFQRADGLPGYREPGTIRTQIPTCGAILGRSARRLVVHMGESWGGLKTSSLAREYLAVAKPNFAKLAPAMRC
ncbi:MAG: transposase [Bryobacteraceae bacterium]|nr:transposase [Bryobacteraceae bacterium]